jgi:UDP-glucose 4-epimerase
MITGVNGFIGSHLAEKLLKDGFEVFGLDVVDHKTSKNLSEIIKDDSFYYTKGDIQDFETINNFFQNDAEVIYHLASVVGVRKYMEDPMSLIDIAIIGTKNIINKCMYHNVRLLFASTSEIYGKNPDTPWKENSDRVLGNPSIDRWCYASSKALVEHMLFALHRNKKLDFSTVRFFNVYGPKQNPIYVVSQTIHRVLNDMSPDLYDGGKQTRCFTYIDDAINGLISAATSESAIGNVFNIGNQTPTTMKEVINICLQKANKNLSINNVDTLEKYGDVYQDITNRVPDSTKALELLNWEAKIQVAEGIEKTIKWANLNKWYLK